MSQKGTPTVFSLPTRIIFLFQEKIISAKCDFFFPGDKSLLDVVMLGAYKDG